MDVNGIVRQFASLQSRQGNGLKSRSDFDRTGFRSDRRDRELWIAYSRTQCNKHHISPSGLSYIN